LVELCFLASRRFIPYLKNITSELRLVGITLFSIQQGIYIHHEMVFKEFSNSEKEENLKII